MTSRIANNKSFKSPAHATRSLLRRSLIVANSYPVAVRLAALLLTVILISVSLAPQLSGFDPMQLSNDALAGPGGLHLLGTDNLGRDMFSRVLHGGRISILVGVSSAIIAVVLGLSVGLVAGFSGGLIDELLMRFTEIFQIVPKLLVAIVVVALVGGSMLNVILVLGILSWPPTARIIRSQVLVLRKEEFVSAAILSGATYLRILTRHLLPNIMPFLFVSASLQVATAILTEAALSFLGLGDPSSPSWGLMLQQSQSYLRQAWWMSVFPGSFLALTILSLNLLGDGLSSRLPGNRQ